MPINHGAFFIGGNKEPLEIREKKYPSPKDNELVIHNRAVAVNPVDWMKQELGSFLFGHMKYPCGWGEDCAGEVVAVGKAVTRFKAGDRVAGYAVGTSPKHYDHDSEVAWQDYVVLRQHMTTKIPDHLSYETACVIGLGVSTAASGLFQKDQLGLQHPTEPKRQATGETLIVWGGSTSVGVNAIQLAVAAGYEVFTTCSPRNFELVKRLGATQAWDYNSPSVIKDMIAAMTNKRSAGAIAIGSGSADACFEILGKSQGSKKVAIATFPLPDPLPQSFLIPKIVAKVVPWVAYHTVREVVRGVKWKAIFGSSLEENEVGPVTFEYLEEALEEGSFICVPEPQIVGSGLESIQKALDTLKAGVSAKKVVVSLP